jgi:organic hydroperoxide reductase OsmC/OhrA
MKWMKIRFEFCVAIFVLILSLAAGSIASELEKRNNEKKADTTYKVRVEVKEIKNRIVEGKVRNHTIRVDQPKEFGADDTGPTPPETLAFALGSCFVSTGRLIALQRNMSLRAVEAVVESELDFAKTLGTGSEAAEAAGRLRESRDLMRKRVNAALSTFKDQSNEVPLDASRISAIGFCFGGGVVLELALSGRPAGAG